MTADATRATLRALDQQRADTLADALDLDAIEDAAREELAADAPRCACCGDVATRICRGCYNTWCALHDGAPQCACAMEAIDHAAGDARAALVAARHDRDRAEADIATMRREIEALWRRLDRHHDDTRAAVDDVVRRVAEHLGCEGHAHTVTQVCMCAMAMRVERDAALAAVDAVRADYAPRATPPTADEVRALNRLRYGAYAPERQVPVLVWRSDWPDEVRVQWTHVREDAPGGPQVQRLEWSSAWQAMGPDGPVAWSALARLVAQGGAR